MTVAVLNLDLPVGLRYLRMRQFVWCDRFNIKIYLCAKKTRSTAHAR
ncbi:hypothetical protein [Fischerella sp.]|nr:hypothetical protein [Fischerella sp.]